MGDREELDALRRMAELEAKAKKQAPSPLDPYIHNKEYVATEMPATQRALAGVGKAFSDVGSGIAQRFGFGPSPQEVQDRREADVPLMATGAGFLGNVTGGAALTVPAAAIPGAASIPGAALLGGAFGAAQPTAPGESAVKNAALGAVVGGGMQYGVGKIAPWLADKLSTQTAQTEASNARASRIAEVLKRGQDLGLKVPPSQANPSMLNRVLESIGGKAATQQGASAANQDIAYAAGQKAAGLQPNQAITEETLAAARDAAAAPYRQVADLSSQAKSALQAWKEANFEAKMQWNFFNKSGNPQAYQAAKTAEAGAQQALDTIDQIAAQHPNAQGLVEALKGARVQIAKTHTVEDVMRGSSLNPQALAAALQRGVPLSGDLKTIAQVAQDFPKAMAAPQVGGSVGVNQLLPWLGGGGGGAVGAAIGGAPGAGIGSVAGMAATQAIPPAARSLILSSPYQKLMTTPPQMSPDAALRLANALAKSGLLPAASAYGATQ